MLFRVSNLERDSKCGTVFSRVYRMQNQENMNKTNKNTKTVAIVLASGRGTRMGGDVPKQYMDVCGKPLLYYTIKAFEDSFIEKIVLVCGKGDEDYVREQIVSKYGFDKVCGIAYGGRERYHSVYNGLKYIKDNMPEYAGDDCVVFIHDGARPLVNGEILKKCYEDTLEYGSGVAAVMSKDTVKIADENGFVVSTPQRDKVYLMQTPQTFSFGLIEKAYGSLMDDMDRILQSGITITDDAMVLEYFSDKKVKLSEGSYENIKVTTPEDMGFLENCINKNLY